METFALIGCGRIAKRHAEILKSDEIDTTLVGVCDIVEKKAIEFSEKYGVPAFFDLDKMLDEVKPDYAVILTPSGLHHKNVIQAAKHQCAIIVEKPIALRIEHANEMIEACSKNKVPLYVVKQNRYNVPILRLKEHLAKGKLGKFAPHQFAYAGAEIRRILTKICGEAQWNSMAV